MKKTFVAALVMFPLVASANEISRGVVALKGASTIGWSSATDEIKWNDGSKRKTETDGFKADIQGLYYLFPGIGIGAIVGYMNETTKTTEEPGGIRTKTTTDLLLIGPAAGVDISLAPHFGLFGEAAVGYALGGRKDDGASRTGMSGFGLQVGGGLKLFLERHFSFDVGLAYQYVKIKSDDALRAKPEITDSNLGVKLGLSVYFGGK